MTRRLALGALLAMLLGGCAGVSLPSAATPSCSWDSRVPANSAAICTAVFRTLNTVAAAVQSGDNATIARLVRKDSVRKRLVSYGRTLRLQHVKGLHVVPSLTLDAIRPHLVGAGFYLSVRGGHANAPQTVELHVAGSRAVIINDQPGQEW